MGLGATPWRRISLAQLHLEVLDAGCSSQTVTVLAAQGKAGRRAGKPPARTASEAAAVLQSSLQVGSAVLAALPVSVGCKRLLFSLSGCLDLARSPVGIMCGCA